MSEYNTYGSVPAGPPNNSMAIISLVAGILGLTIIPLVGSIVAVITGPMAKREIAASGGAMGGEGLATAGMVLGWIGIALAVFGLCMAAFFIAIPICGGIIFGISTQEYNLFLPSLLTLF